jgi:hypothetical protein
MHEYIWYGARGSSRVAGTCNWSSGWLVSCSRVATSSSCCFSGLNGRWFVVVVRTLRSHGKVKASLALCVCEGGRRMHSTQLVIKCMLAASGVN